VKRLHVRLRAQANQDTKEIFDWISSESGHPPTAENFIGRIYDACQTLGEFPLKGRARDDLKQGVRTLPFERIAVITYRVLTDEVEVLNIFYGGRDWETIVTDMSVENPED
jgi:toxin ParE1/3/4